MKWCQTCKFEYEDYVEKCTDCGALLISEVQYNIHTEHENHVHNPDGLNLTVVYEATHESDVLLVSELLKENGIHSEIKNNGIGSYLQIYSGVNYLGTSICVREDDADDAKAIIENLWGESDPEAQLDLDSDEDKSSMNEYRHQYNKSLNQKRNLLKLFLLFIFGSAIVIQLISALN